VPGADGGPSTDGSVTKVSPRPVADTVARLVDLLDAKGLKVFAVIDQQAEARAAGIDLRETTLVMFGNPAAGTSVMAAEPLAALDLPLKVLVWPSRAAHLRQLYRAGRPRRPLRAQPRSGGPAGRRRRADRRADRGLNSRGVLSLLPARSFPLGGRRAWRRT